MSFVIQNHQYNQSSHSSHEKIPQQKQSLKNSNDIFHSLIEFYFSNKLNNYNSMASSCTSLSCTSKCCNYHGSCPEDYASDPDSNYNSCYTYYDSTTSDTITKIISIVSSVAGALMVLTIVILIFYFCWKKKKLQEEHYRGTDNHYEIPQILQPESTSYNLQTHHKKHKKNSVMPAQLVARSSQLSPQRPSHEKNRKSFRNSKQVDDELHIVQRPIRKSNMQYVDAVKQQGKTIRPSKFKTSKAYDEE